MRRERERTDFRKTRASDPTFADMNHAGGAERSAVRPAAATNKFGTGGEDGKYDISLSSGYANADMVTELPEI